MNTVRFYSIIFLTTDFVVLEALVFMVKSRWLNKFNCEKNLLCDYDHVMSPAHSLTHSLICSYSCVKELPLATSKYPSSKLLTEGSLVKIGRLPNPEGAEMKINNCAVNQRGEN